MKSKYFLVGLFLILVIFIFFSIIGLTNNIKYDFRKTNWKMSMEQVKATEDKKPDWESDHYIDLDEEIQEGKSIEYFPVEINGKNYTCQYVFLENKLYRGRYRSFGSDFFYEYEMLKGLLNKKYGKAVFDQELWLNPTYKDNSFYIEEAIKLGHLIKVIIWQTSTTHIKLKLGADTERIMLTVSYYSKELLKQKREKEEKERINKLTEEENKSNL